MGDDEGTGGDRDDSDKKMGGDKDKGWEDDNDKDDNNKDGDNNEDDGGNSIVRVAPDRHKSGTMRCNGATRGRGANGWEVLA